MKIVLPVAVPGPISAGIFAFTLSWNEFIYALTFELGEQDRRLRLPLGPLMAAALLGLLPAFGYFLRLVLSLGADGRAGRANLNTA